MEKKNLLVSFSGGETSAFMAQWLWKNKQDQFNMVFVFANTGQENEETLKFVQKCEDNFGFPVVWVEGIYSKKLGVGAKSKVVDFKTADRKGKVFEEMISVYGIPNQANPQCTRELKGAVINHYARNVLKWKTYYTAIGIRADEADRINKHASKKKFIYPLISKQMIPMTKPKINFFWKMQSFNLGLKGYQGNCKWCWKKSLPKLQKIAYENPEAFDFPKKMEAKYGNFLPKQRIEKWLSEGKEIPKDITFFRNYLSAKDIVDTAYNHKVFDDSNYTGHQLDLIGGESCEVWAECGD